MYLINRTNAAEIYITKREGTMAITDDLATGINRGFYKVIEREKKIVPVLFAGKQVVISSPDKRSITTASDSSENHEEARNLYSLYERDIKPQLESIKKLQKEAETEERLLQKLDPKSRDELETNHVKNLARANYQTYKNLAGQYPSEQLEALADNVDAADAISDYIANKSSQTKGLKLFVDKLIDAKLDSTFKKMPPEKRSRIQQEFIQITTKQFPQEHQPILEATIARSGESKDYFENDLNPIVKQLAKTNTHSPKRLFPTTIPKGKLFNFINTSTLKNNKQNKADKDQWYFVNNKGEPMRWSKTADTFHNTDIQNAVENFELYQNELLPYSHLNANEFSIDKDAPLELDTLTKKQAYWEKRLKKAVSDKGHIYGQKLERDNPNLTDLSNESRPMKIGEHWSSLYGDEWVVAYEEMEKNTESTKEITTNLLNIALTCYEQSKKLSNMGLMQDINSMLKSAKLSNEQQKEYESEWKAWLGHFESSSVIEKSIDSVATEVAKQLQIKPGPELKSYINKCAKLCHTMVRTNPPLVLETINKGDPIDRNRFNLYNTSGKKTDYAVWPALCLYEKGPILSKGSVQPLEESQIKKK